MVECDASFGSDDSTEDASYTTRESSDVSRDGDSNCTDGGGFAVGDHVYRWCSYLGIPRAYQHHGIVVSVSQEFISVVDFYGIVNEEEEAVSGEKTEEDTANGKPEGLHGSSGSSGGGSSSRCSLFSSTRGSGSKDYGERTGSMCEYTVDESIARTTWRRVRYGARWSERLLRRSGTCSPANPDETNLVLARIDYLLENQHLVPPYHVLKSNCECVAVWCITGQFCSLQGSAMLSGAASGVAGSAAALGGKVASTQVAAPAAGIWGWMGLTSTVPLTATAPMLMPAIMLYGVSSTAAPIAVLLTCKGHWEKATDALNLAFAHCNLRGKYLPHLPWYQV